MDDTRVAENADGWEPTEAFAARCGVSPQAIRSDIQAGQIKSWKKVGRRILIHVERAEQERATAKDYTRASVDVIEGLDGEDGGFSLKAELAREKHWKANIAELEYRVKSGELIPAEEVEEKFTAAVTAAKTKLLGISRRIQQRMPHISAEDVKAIHELVREALEDLAYGR